MNNFCVICLTLVLLSSGVLLLASCISNVLMLTELWPSFGHGVLFHQYFSWRRVEGLRSEGGALYVAWLAFPATSPPSRFFPALGSGKGGGEEVMCPHAPCSPMPSSIMVSKEPTLIWQGRTYNENQPHPANTRKTFGEILSTFGNVVFIAECWQQWLENFPYGIDYLISWSVEPNSPSVFTTARHN